MGLEANLTSPSCFPGVSQGFSHVSFSDCLGGATLQNWDLRTGCAVKGTTVMIHYIYDIMTIYSIYIDLPSGYLTVRHGIAGPFLDDVPSERNLHLWLGFSMANC